MKRAVVLDRDGVINDNSKPVNRPEDLVLFSDAGSAISRLNEAGFIVCVATNQGGVGLGYMTEANLDRVHRAMLDELKEDGAVIDDIAACIHAPNAGCVCRKPNPGMLLDLARRCGFSPLHSFMVGDRDTDVEAGQKAGMKTVLIGHGPTTANYQALTLTEAVDWILSPESLS